MHVIRRLLLPLAGSILAVACVNGSDPGTIQIPANAIVYKIDAALLRYEFVDTTANTQYYLTWLPLRPYVGFNCLGLVPRSSLDTTGTFVFAYAGPNTGMLERRENGTTDSVTAYFLPPNNVSQGTHGTYAVDSSGRLKLFWADGTQSRYFDPSANLRLYGDTIQSIADQRANGDSVRVQWEVYWTFDNAC